MSFYTCLVQYCSDCCCLGCLCHCSTLLLLYRVSSHHYVIIPFSGLSLALGSAQCLPCSNNYLALLIPFALAGPAVLHTIVAIFDNSFIMNLALLSVTNMFTIMIRRDQIVAAYTLIGIASVFWTGPLQIVLHSQEE